MNSAKEAICRFRSYLDENGYSKNVVKNYGFRLSTFLKAYPDAYREDEHRLRQVIEEYIAALPQNTARTIPAGALRTWWSSLYSKPYKQEIVIANFPKDDLIESECQEYEKYLRNLCSLGEATVRGNTHTVRQFLYTTFLNGSFSQEEVTCDTVLKFVTETLAHTTANTRSGMVARLRSYARYLKNCGVDVGFLDRISFSFPNRRDRIAVGQLSEKSYRALLAACSKTSERGRRDIAIIRCLGNLGLRACDVAGLTLDDIDWRNGILSVKNSKSKTERKLPLDKDTGCALEAYVMRYRIQGENDALFLDSKGDAVTSTKIQTTVRLAAGRASISEYHGTHGLRRMVATNMINAGIDIKVIADVLGHERIATTTAYTKVNITSLKKVTAPWPKEI